MKKVHLFVLSFLALVGLVLSACQNPVSASGALGEEAVSRVATSGGTVSYLENFIDNRLLAGAAAEIGFGNGEMGYSNLYLHFGFNNWQQAQDVPLTINGINNPYLWAHIQIPAWATVLDYCAYVVNADGSKTWDNNEKRDWHVPVYQTLVDTADNAGVKTITYIGRLSPAKLHWGKNGWQNVTDSAMGKDNVAIGGGYARWKLTLNSLAASDVVNFCFSDAAGANWENNNGTNWAVGAASTTVLILPTQYQPELEGALVTYYVNGLYAGSSNLYSATNSFRAYASGKTGDWTVKLDLVKDGKRYTGSAQTRITGSSGTLSLPIVVQTWN